MDDKQEKLFDLINDNGYDMEDLIETISHQELNRLIEDWTEQIKEDNTEK